MRAAVAQAEQAGRVVEHLADRPVVAGDVVHHREVEILAVLEHVVVGHLFGRAAFALRDRGDALLRAGLVVRRIAHDEELVEALGDDLAELRELGDLGFRRLVGQDFPPHLGIAQPPALLLDRQAFERLVARPHRERIERGADAHHHADRPARHLRGQRQALGARLVHGLHQPPPALRVLVAVGEQEPDRAAGLLGELAHPAQLVLLVVEVAVHAERAGAGDAQRRADAEQLVVVGVARRHQLAVRRLVRIGARGGEAERAGSAAPRW